MIDIPDFQIVIDSREQKKYSILGAVIGTLSTGDYSIQGLEDRFAIERKSLGDAWSSLAQDHDRFRQEMERAKDFLAFEIIIEATPEKFIDTWREGRKIHPNSLCGSVVKWRRDYGIQWVFVGNAAKGRRYVEWRLRQWWEEYRAGLWTPPTAKAA